MQQPTHFTAADWRVFLTGEVLAASLLGKTLYSYPDKLWLQALVDEGVFSESPLGEMQPDVQRGLDLLQTWTEGERGGISPADFDNLRADYTALFVGIGVVLAPPWESVYFSDERLVFQEQTLQVRAWYQRFGLEAANHSQEPDDHIGLELLFVAHLAQGALAALETQDEVGFEEMLAAQREFLAEHLLRWDAQWCALVQSHAKTDFFRGLALLTSGVLAEITRVCGLQGQAAVSHR